MTTIACITLPEGVLVPLACHARMAAASAAWKSGDPTDTLAVQCPVHPLGAPGERCWTPATYLAEYEALRVDVEAGAVQPAPG